MRRIAWLAAAGAVLVVGVLSACAKEEAAGPTTLVIGDSLTVGAKLGGLGPDDGVSIDAVEGRTTEEGIAVLEDKDLSGYQQVIVALGTNDYTDTEAEVAPKIARMVKAADGRPVIWENVDAGTSKLAPAADGVNAALALVEQAPGKLTVADWDRYINSRDDADELRAGDGVHDSTKGYRVRADWIADLAQA